MKKLIYLTMIACIACMTACTSVYGPSRSAYDLGYTARPVYEGKKQTNIQGALQFNSDNGFSQNEVQNGGEASISIQTIDQNYGYSIGAFGYISNYRIRPARRSLSAFGYGGRFSIYKNKVMNNWQWRPYGLEVGLSFEQGNFQSFREEQPSTAKVSTSTVIPSVGVSSELVYLPSFLAHSSMGARVVVGSSFYQFNDSDNSFQPFVMVSPFMTWERYTAYANLKFDQRFGASIGASFRF